ncbi:ABC transporter permease [Alicyclobacillus acidiphilus]|uniref:ABC transporter permease n=1 Tax=Alicyclobacillus acidiphilus TaxID=182455 RepID=UPI00082A1575|nr:ABC transporter permease [Alicyclobacillus acidiphilus]
MNAFRASLIPFWRNRVARLGTIILCLFILMAIVAPWISPYSPQDSNFSEMLSPTLAHPLGTTQDGHDVLSQLIYGTRVSLLVGFVAGLGTTLLSLLIGLLAGYMPGVVDEVLSYVTNVFLVLPALPLMIVLAAYAPVKGEYLIVIVIIVTSWSWGARVLRAQVTTLRTRDYVVAARFSGDGVMRIMFKEIFPNMMSLVAASFLGAAISAILGEAGLEFLGLGDPNINSWGTMLYWAQNSGAMLQGQWAWLAAPGLCIALLGTALVLMNFAVDELANPRLRRN